MPYLFRNQTVKFTLGPIFRKEKWTQNHDPEPRPGKPFVNRTPEIVSHLQ